jgi:hypothetical protein
MLTVVDFLDAVTDHNFSEDSCNLPQHALERILRRPSLAKYDKAYDLACAPKPGPVIQRIAGRPNALVDIDTTIHKMATGLRYYHVMTRCPISSTLKHVSFEPYRKLGFAIWDGDRMFKLGFLGVKQAKYELMATDYGLWFIWRSVLTPEEDAERRSDALLERVRMAKGEE